MRLFLPIFLFPIFGYCQTGPFAPQAGLSGSTAIAMNSDLFRDWAGTCQVRRGLRDTLAPDSGRADAGMPANALYRADGLNTVSLGDGGVATLTFHAPIMDGEGPDFAVFENGISQGVEAFLELAFVEVSSDGEHFYRFPSSTTVDTTSQIGSFDLLDASQIHNLAGKYAVGFGVPFDLAELDTVQGLNTQFVTHVRIVDAIGSILPEIASRTSDNVIVNDPYPTNFSSSGFDLDAVGVINSMIPQSIAEGIEQNSYDTQVRVFDMLGNFLGKIQNGRLPDELPSGLYLIISDEPPLHTKRLILK